MAVQYMYLPTENNNRWLFSTCTCQQGITADSCSVHVPANRGYQQMAVQCFSTCTCQQRISTDCCLVLQCMYLPAENINRLLFSASVHVLANREYQQIAVWCFSACTCQQRITTNGCSVHVLKLPVNREDQQMTGDSVHVLANRIPTNGPFWCFM